MKTEHLYQLSFLVSLFIAGPYLASSGGGRANAACLLLDSSRSAVFISYEGVAEGRSYSDVRLRLHNNSDCPIVVETDDHDPFVFRGKKNVSLHYLLYDGPRQTLKPAYGWGDSVFKVEIRSDESVWFLVPWSHFKKRFHLAVPFSFAWEGKNDVVAGGVGRVGHYVFFLVDEIPAQDRRRH
jgi:hypothetical protein